MMRTGNPALNENTFNSMEFARSDFAAGRMTIQGAAGKTMILLGFAFATAIFSYGQVVGPNPGNVLGWCIGGAIVALISGLAISFVPTWAPFLAPVYALSEGLLLGGISGIYELKFPGSGIVLQAASATFGTLFALLLAYQARLIRATENFKLGVFAATGGIAVVYLIGFVGRFFGWQIPLIHESGLVGIGFSIFVVIIAALNLVLDFDFIEEAANRGAPKYLEWVGAFGLMVTLVWLYIEMLRLLAKLNSRND